MTMMLAPSKAVLAADKPEGGEGSSDGAKPSPRARHGARAKEAEAEAGSGVQADPSEVAEAPAASADAA
jgi:hypothetical protein